MAVQILTGLRLYFGGHLMSPFYSQLSLETGADLLDGSRFSSSSTRTRAVGMKESRISLDGFFSSNADFGSGPDEFIHGQMGVEQSLAVLNNFGSAIQVTPTGSTTAGDETFFMLSDFSEYQLTGRVGEMFGASLNATSKDELVKGLQTDVGRTGAGGNGTGVQLTGFSSTAVLYAIVHVSDITGGNITVSVERDDNAGFTSPTSLVTLITTSTTEGTVYRKHPTVLDLTTENYFRMVYSGTHSSSTVAAAAFAAVDVT